MAQWVASPHRRDKAHQRPFMVQLGAAQQVQVRKINYCHNLTSQIRILLSNGICRNAGAREFSRCSKADQFCVFFNLKRPAKKVSLDPTAACLRQKLTLRLCLNAFGQDRYVQGMSKTKDRTNDRN